MIPPAFRRKERQLLKLQELSANNLLAVCRTPGKRARSEG
jgi:hypothetical protein